MHFGFTYITDESREKLEELGILYRKTESGWEVFTHTADLKKSYDRNLFEATIERYELEEQLKHQKFKYWKHPEYGFYYYLIQGGVFVMYQKRCYDNSTIPPTTYESTIFDWIEDQEKWLDFFSNIPEAVDILPM